MALDGVEIFCNSSASHTELRKAYFAVDLIKDATKKCGGIYVFANQRGCDGDRLYFDGKACIAVNGSPVVQGSQFGLREVEVVCAAVDLEEVRTYKNQIRSSRNQAAQDLRNYLRIRADFALGASDGADSLRMPPAAAIEWKFHTPEEEIALGPACFLWDYLRRSGQHGYFLALSGGRDSAAVACIVYSMCRLVCDAVKNGKKRFWHRSFSKS